MKQNLAINLLGCFTLLSICACSSDGSDGNTDVIQPPVENKLAINISTNISSRATEEDEAKHARITFTASHPGSRATETAFENNDKIGIYIAKTNSPLEIGGNLVNNTPFTFDGAAWSSKSQQYWEDGTYEAYAYYPYIANIASIEEQMVNVSTDQNSAKTADRLGGNEASDILFATTKGITPPTKPVHLSFRHIMSKLKIRLVKGEDFEGEMPKTAEVYVLNTVPTATIDQQAGIATRYVRGTSQTIKAHKDDDYTYSAIIVPQRIDTRLPLIEVVMEGVSYICNSRFVFKPGMEHLVNVVIDKNANLTKIDINGSTTKWQ